jgi:hypothetical protein
MQSTTSSTATDNNIVEALRRELSTAHRRAAATAEILKLISHSRDQLQPVLDAIVAMARQLCQADYALIFRLLGGAYRLAAASQAEAAHITYASDHPIAPGRGSCVARTGLQIIEMHGGRIWVESTLGKGSTFRMELPTRAEFSKRAP